MEGFARTDNRIQSERAFCDDHRRFCRYIPDRACGRDRSPDVAADARSACPSIRRFVTLGVERIFDLAALASFFAINLLWFNPPAGREREFGYIKLAGYVMLAGMFLGFFALFIYQRRSKKIIEWTARVLDKVRVPERIKRIVLSILRQLATALGLLRDWREIVKVSIWTSALWLAIAIPTWLVLLAFDLPLSFGDALFIMGFATVSSVVPTPGGAAGAFHAATAGGLIFLNITQENAAATAIAMHLIYFAPAIVFGLFYFIHGDISIERFRSLLSGDNAVDEIESEAPNGNGKLKMENGE